MYTIRNGTQWYTMVHNGCTILRITHTQAALLESHFFPQWHTQAALLESHFFPQWHAVLRHWLSHQPDFDEVTRWMAGWRGAFPTDLADTQRIRAQLALGQDALARCMAGQPLPPLPATGAPVGVPPEVPGQGVGKQGPASRPLAAATVDTSMRALVEQFAIDNNVALVPKVCGEVVRGEMVV